MTWRRRKIGSETPECWQVPNRHTVQRRFVGDHEVDPWVICQRGENLEVRPVRHHPGRFRLQEVAEKSSFARQIDNEALLIELALSLPNGAFADLGRRVSHAYEASYVSVYDDELVQGLDKKARASLRL